MQIQKNDNYKNKILNKISQIEKLLMLKKAEQVFLFFF